MPNLHLTKVAVGCRDLAALERRIAGRREDGLVRVVTRMRPRRMEELVGGSLYWIVKHRLVACQQILRFDDRSDGRIDIVCSATLLAVPPRPSARIRAGVIWRRRTHPSPVTMTAAASACCHRRSMAAWLPWPCFNGSRSRWPSREASPCSLAGPRS